MVWLPRKTGVLIPGPLRAAPAERLLVGAAAAAFLHLAMFRDGTFVYLFHKATTGVWIDEGIRVADGEVMYRDFFETIGPGLVYMNAALARIFGASLATFAHGGLALGVLLAVALHALSARLVPSPWRLLPPLFFVVLVYPPFDLGHPRWPALLLGILGVERAAFGTGFRRTGSAGLALGTATLFARDVGLGVCLGLAAHFATCHIAGSRRSLAGLALGTFGPVLLAMGGFSAAAGLDIVLDDWLVQPGSLALREPSLSLRGAWEPRSVGYLLMGLGGLWAGIRQLRGPATQVASDGSSRRALSCAGLGLLAAAACGEMDSYVLGTHATLLSICLSWQLAGGEALGGTRAWIGRGLLCLLAPGLVHGAAGLIVRRQWLEPLIRQRFRGGETWIRGTNEEMPWVERHTRIGDFTFVLPAGGLYYGLTRTRNATSFHSMIEGRVRPEQQKKALAEIETRKPTVGLWLGAQRFAPQPGLPRLDVLYRGLLDAYDVERTLRNGTLLLRRRTQGRPAGCDPGSATTAGKTTSGCIQAPIRGQISSPSDKHRNGR